MYGQGQSDKSLLSQLDMAIQNKNPVFKLSVGDQLRDYLPIESVIENLCLAIETPEVNGVINCCSGNPTSVFDLVTEKIKESGYKFSFITNTCKHRLINKNRDIISWHIWII